MIDTSLPLLASVTSELNSDADLAGLLGAGTRIFSRPDEKQKMPYVVVYDGSQSEWAPDRMEHLLDIHIFDRTSNPAKAINIRSRIVELLQGHSVDETSGKSVCFHWDSNQLLYENEGDGVNHAVASFVVKMRGV